MNFGNHAREFRGGAETMTSNDATWDTIEAPKKPRVQKSLGSSTLRPDVNKREGCR